MRFFPWRRAKGRVSSTAARSEGTLVVFYILMGITIFFIKKQQCQTTHPVIRNRAWRNVPLLYRPELPGLLRGEAVVEHPAEGQEVLAAGVEGAVGGAQDDSEREKMQQALCSSKENENKDLQ